MPSQREVDQNNNLSRIRQQTRRGSLDAYGFPAEKENLLQNLEQRKAKIGNSYDTRQSRRLRDQIDTLKNEKSEAINKFNIAYDIAKNKLDVDNTRIQIPTFDERERAAGLFDTESGRKSDIPNLEDRARKNQLNQLNEQAAVFSDEEDQMATFGVIIAINGEPYVASIYGQIAGKLEG
tara:strand:+ start:626 stop:1162 length:537 start_codon:yes stop_codon:yes gene_type:complete